MQKFVNEFLRPPRGIPLVNERTEDSERWGGTLQGAGGGAPIRERLRVSVERGAGGHPFGAEQSPSARPTSGGGAAR
jgi:hypothetical protein